MTRLLGPDFISLQVDDLDTARHFYTERLGLVPAPHSPPGAIVFQTQPIAFAVRTLLAETASVRAAGVALWFACDDVDGLHARLAAQGVPIVTAPAAGPFGRFFTLSDPFGYTLTAHQAA